MIFTYVVDFRGGVYCSQLEATDVHSSILVWVQKIKKEMNEIKYLGIKTNEEVRISLSDPDNEPIELKGLKKIWFTYCTTKKGAFHINIIQTNTTGNV